MSAMTRSSEEGFGSLNSESIYGRMRSHMNPRECEALAARKMASNIACCPPRSKKIAYGNTVEMALRLEKITYWLVVSTSVSSFWVISLEISSTRALILGQKGGYHKDRA